MSGSTISTYVTHTVEISPEGYASPLLITNTGAISAPGTRFPAVMIDVSPGVATITNDGLIQVNSVIGHAGFGIADYTSRSKITNNGVIRGGAGYGHVYNYNGPPYASAGYGGAGILVDEHSTIIDTGKIYGGSGVKYDGQSGYGGAGVELGFDVKMTVTRTGTLAGGYGAGSGILMGQSTLDNSGLIIGGAGGGYPAQPVRLFGNPKLGLIGGIGATVGGGGRVLNRGTIAGGAGGSLGETYGGRGGAGLYAFDADKGPRPYIVNLGTIEGGGGGDGSNMGADGGDGVKLGGNSVLTNHGHIFGGAAGVGGVAGSADGGAGVDMYSGSTLLNFGEITAGAGYGIGVLSLAGSIRNAGEIYGSDGGDGVSLNSDSLVNTGLIAGGAGGKGGVGVYAYGSSTLINSGTISGGLDAVVLKAADLNYANTVVVEKGAVFNGDVVANPAAHDVLELAGTSSAALTGIGTQFTGFDKIAFANRAHWTISGDTAGLGSGQAITGFRPGDAITLTDAGASGGAVSVATAGVVSIDAGGVISKMDITGATVGETGFKFSNYTLTESAQPAMAFLAPPAAYTALHALSILDVLQHFAPAAPAPVSLSHAGFMETPMFGASLDPFFAPHIAAVPIVTLHA